MGWRRQACALDPAGRAGSCGCAFSACSPIAVFRRRCDDSRQASLVSGAFGAGSGPCPRCGQGCPSATREGFPIFRARSCSLVQAGPHRPRVGLDLRTPGLRQTGRRVAGATLQPWRGPMKQRSQKRKSRNRVADSAFSVRRLGHPAFCPTGSAPFGVFRRQDGVERLVCSVRDEEAGNAFRDLLEDHLRTLASLS